MHEGSDQTVLLCTQDEALLESADALSAVGYTAVRCSSLKELQLELGGNTVAAVLDASMSKDQTFAMYRFLRKEGKVPFLVLLPAPGSEQPGWVMDVEHGEQEDYARQPISIAELILRLNALLVRTGSITGGSVGFTIAPGAAAAAAMSGYGKIISVYGAHGGTGKTMIAVHLAVGLSELSGARVALVDGDLWGGDMLVRLNLTATRTILDATMHGLPNDPEVWTRVLLDHPSGIRVLPPPTHLEDVERVPEGAVAAAADGLRRYFDFVVVDLDDTPTESTLKVLEMSDMVLVVLCPELGMVRNTVRLLTTGKEIGLKDTLRIILNRADAGLDPKQVESVISRPIVSSIPSDEKLFMASSNAGLTVFEMDAARHAPARRALETLAREIFTAAHPKAVKARGGNGSVLGKLGARFQRQPAATGGGRA